MFIAKKLKEHSTIESLNMELSSIGVNGAKELAKALQHKQSLKSLHLNFNNI